MAYIRKTIDFWKFMIDYDGNGKWECGLTVYSVDERDSVLAEIRYRDNSCFRLKVVKGREKIETPLTGVNHV